MDVAIPIALLVAWACLAGLSVGMLALLGSFLRLEVRRPYRRSLYALARSAMNRSIETARSRFQTFKRRRAWGRVRKQTANRRWMRRA